MQIPKQVVNVWPKKTGGLCEAVIKLTILDMSGMYASIDSDVFYRMYVQIRTKGKEEREHDNEKRMQGNHHSFTEGRSREICNQCPVSSRTGKKEI